MIHISTAAETELKRRFNLQPFSWESVRIGIEAGGCAAWHYTLQMGVQPATDDITIKCSHFQILISKQYLRWLQDLSIDYSEDLVGGSFRFINPNAAQTCGCGSSFTLDPEDSIAADCTHPTSIAASKEVDAVKNTMVM
ncbi:iron-sulfur cluster assembly accessory protein [filamentous cyanobacterium CCP5]|nr:iron-sulfur cluster assembly accessory protein [filamentous cyanobacterium CCP5]